MWKITPVISPVSASNPDALMAIAALLRSK
jgi:hypothetical protein